jgi:hypothetical protein
MRKMSLVVFITIILVLIAAACSAGRKHNEAWYQNRWCEDKGQVEFILPDNTRCDCLTPTHAVEVDFAEKFYEAIGQSLYYSLQTGKRAGIVLIVENISDRKYWIRLNTVIQHFDLPIDTWLIGPENP